MEKSVNVLGQPLQVCGTDPVTGFFRDGYCNTSPSDSGAHTVGAVVSSSFLDFSASRGNDLRPILKDGCSWCLCVSRWKEALDAHRAGQLPSHGVPRVKLDATHQKALDKVTIDDLRAFALDDKDGQRGGPIR
ncbi:uncharacterized protein PFL1_02085 [Pseudozyma flocculosa PF-1]|uniref:DUF2237 domain-containing protein n=1 Tax=Pseudozyma flocculosa TaxID=84751 RepID=A0A5C3F302_9BASI|nr:uncharacterized protein PFL1_02085 [Pseudozyma flocculosa PF-1]EPQ30560.1 hypothetical protein PFL1_02085 [Pseudozyma flocculosa PF-1]SPO37651.1 uncharacterized protein PSFLO_03127 [Pseudozyma flocculosa]